MIRGAEYASCICLVAMLLIIFVNVFLRYVFSRPLYWGDEMMIYLMLLMVYAGFGFALLEDAHIRVTTLFDRLPIKVRNVIWVIISLIAIAYSSYLLYTMILLVQASLQIGSFSMVTRWPIYPWQVVIAVGLFILIVAYIMVAAERVGIALGIRQEKEHKEEGVKLGE